MATPESEGIDDTTDRMEGNSVKEVFPDGSIRFKPPFTKAEAEYREIGSDQYDPSHRKCSTCVHYIPGRGCHFVQGQIDPVDYCVEYYADYGAFVHDRGRNVVVNAELVGDEWSFDDADIEDFVSDLEERMEQRKREMKP